MTWELILDGYSESSYSATPRFAAARLPWFLVGLITSVARIRSGGLLLPVLLHMEATTLGLLFG
ncbi:hypothetical protein E2K61_11305 [Escherichia coli]|nr:hypothetical protein [Escherichia coli]KAA0599590.1 hypothetical protein E2K70_25305 [Escherichia coli]KAA0669846.1 hypothetical protein E2K61_11305 [Escherichia coli]